MLEEIVRKHLRQKELLVMAHLVLGYPSFEENRLVINAMAKAITHPQSKKCLINPSQTMNIITAATNPPI